MVVFALGYAFGRFELDILLVVFATAFGDFFLRIACGGDGDSKRRFFFGFAAGTSSIANDTDLLLLAVDCSSSGM